MHTLFSKRSTIILFFLILIVFFIARMFPSTGIVLGVIFLIFGLVTSIYMAVKKHREDYLHGKVSLSVAIRNIALEITAILLAMILAALLGRTLAEIGTRHIDNALLQFIAGVGIGLSVGMIVGLLIKRASSHLVKT